MVRHILEENILIAKLDNPPSNSMTFESLNLLRDAVKKVNDDNSIKGLIITGEGRFFSSGFDLPTFLSFRDKNDVLNFFNVEEEMMYEIFTCKKPVIAAINGHCAAGGFIVSMGCDYRIGVDSPKPKIGMTEIKIGLSLTIAEMELVRWGVNSNRDLRDVMYNGETYSLLTAKEKGYIDELVNAENLIASAKEKICYWIDQPERAFIQLKAEIKKPAAVTIRERLDNENWQDDICAAILNPKARMVFEKVQKTMAGGR
jgi:enoyl-CoA hydratase/carnithine racemase